MGPLRSRLTHHRRTEPPSSRLRRPLFSRGADWSRCGAHRFLGVLNARALVLPDSHVHRFQLHGIRPHERVLRLRRHALLPGVDLSIPIRAEYEDYLRTWREEAITRADAGDIAMSICLQATFADLALHGKLVHDWLGVMDEFLTVDGAPVAYSAAYGKRLHRFDAQYIQSTIHAIHSRWWIETLNGRTTDHDAFADRVLAKKQSDGLIYDRDISETIL